MPEVSSAKSLILADMATRNAICAYRSTFLAEDPPVYFTMALYYGYCSLLGRYKIVSAQQQHKCSHDASIVDTEAPVEREQAMNAPVRRPLMLNKCLLVGHGSIMRVLVLRLQLQILSNMCSSEQHA